MKKSAKTELMVLLLALAGAGVDAIMIMGFAVLTAAQTGNTILLAVAVAKGELITGLSAGISVLAFVLGVAGGRAFLTRLAKTGSVPSPVAKLLMTQIVLLVIVILLWNGAGRDASPPLVLLMVAFAAISMGVQSAAMRHLHKALATTYVTGVLTAFTCGIVDSLGKREPPRSEPLRSVPDRPWKFGFLWLTYALGAVAAGSFYVLFRELALLWPVAAIAAVVLLNPQSAGE